MFAVLLEAVKKDPALADEIGRAPGESESTRPAATPRKRRKPGAFDPYAVFEQGEVALRTKLKELDVDALKDIVAEHGMDPARLVRKWKRPERIAEHIVATVQARSRKGDAFRS